ncbi:MAG TPA: SDR family oxidoreductase, partial [Planctomycetaceae bacterium]|nr:SDR family oxidoreductase [Planctomycetaceae bacterium]
MNSKPMNLRANAGEHRIALVTGASGGLGAQIARSLAARGWTVLAASRSAKVPFMEEDLARRIEPMRLDVIDKNSIAELGGTLKKRGLAIDLLVNNAGINASGVVEEISDEQGRTIMDTNFYGVAGMIRAILPEMRKRRSGTILTIGSLAGLMAPPGEAFYAASKHALEGFLEALQYEVTPFGVRICLAEPGFIATNLASAAAQTGAAIPDYDNVRQALKAHWEASISSGMKAAEMADRIIAWTLEGTGFRRR